MAKDPELILRQLVGALYRLAKEIQFDKYEAPFYQVRAYIQLVKIESMMGFDAKALKTLFLAQDILKHSEIEYREDFSDQYENRILCFYEIAKLQIKLNPKEIPKTIEDMQKSLPIDNLDLHHLLKCKLGQLNVYLNRKEALQILEELRSEDHLSTAILFEVAKLEAKLGLKVDACSTLNQLRMDDFKRKDSTLIRSFLKLIDKLDKDKAIRIVKHNKDILTRVIIDFNLQNPHQIIEICNLVEKIDRRTFDNMRDEFYKIPSSQYSKFGFTLVKLLRATSFGKNYVEGYREEIIAWKNIYEALKARSRFDEKIKLEIVKICCSSARTLLKRYLIKQ